MSKFLRNYSVKHYYGNDSDKPTNLPNGDFYHAIDTGISYRYNNQMSPVAQNDPSSIGRSLIGWQDYADSNTSEANPLEQTNIFGGEVQLTNNNNDTATDGNTNINGNTTVEGINDIWDTSTNTFTFKDTGIEKNDLFLIRFHVKENPTIVPQTFGIRMDFYDDVGGLGNKVFDLPGTGRTLTESAGVFEPDIIYVEGYFGESILNGSAKVFLEGTKSFEAEVIGWKVNIYKIAR